MKGTGKITYFYEVEGKRVAVWREHAGTAYARNGNAGNATEYFTWHASVNGEHAATGKAPARASSGWTGRPPGRNRNSAASLRPCRARALTKRRMILKQASPAPWEELT